MAKDEFRFTVFTPTFNRAHTLGRLYASLKRQSFSNFEWLVVDDGSTDDTAMFFEKIQSEESGFPIRYLPKENGGKHTAINLGVQQAKGTLFCIVDSDDYLTDDALELADRLEKSIPPEKKQEFAGICGQKCYDPDHPIGTTFSGEIMDITSLERLKFHIEGDKAEIFYTDILKKYPFPAFQGEKFLTECIVWFRIAADGYKLRFSQDLLMVCEYQQDGLTGQGYQRLLEQNPRGYGLYIAQQREYAHWPDQRRKETYREYYYQYRDRFHLREMAGILHLNPIKFSCFVYGMRLKQAIREKILKKER